MAKMKQTNKKQITADVDVDVCGGGVRSLYSLLLGLQTGAAAMEIIVEVPHKIVVGWITKSSYIILGNILKGFYTLL